MVYRIDVLPKKEIPHKETSSHIKDIGIKKSFEAYRHMVYFIDADAGPELILDIASRLLVDPVIERFEVSRGFFSGKPQDCELLITYNPGVCDHVSLSLLKAMADLGAVASGALTAKYYRFPGLKKEDILSCASKILFNPLIEHVVEYDKVKNLTDLGGFAGKDYCFELVIADILSANEQRLMEISRQGCLSLSLEEMRIIKDYFSARGNNPTDCELETIATLWSEHCCHKTFRGVIEYQEKDSCGNEVKKETINGLLKATVMKATREINHKGCVSVFHDNSGIVKFDSANNICFKVETHNHPSSLEPYGGASTGIGGVIRDILGTGCGAKPFANTDVFCFSPWDIKYDDLPKGLLHPKRVINGVVSGVRDYGNRMGIPTVAGAVIFDERFLGNPLVFCGTLGIIPGDKSFKKAETGDVVILCGAKTGRDGIHGATFSSRELDEQTVALNSAVQIGNPIEEKKLTEAILRCRDKDLFNAITDCGAGGISSAITEIAAEYGVEVWLDKVPLKYRGLSYTEIWISESQERMVFTAKEENIPKLKSIFAEEDVEMAVVGRVTGDHKLKLFYSGNKVCELDMDFIFNLPQLAKKATWHAKKEEDIKVTGKKSYNKDLLGLLSSPNISPKEWILRQYDHEVQAGSVLKTISSNVGRLCVSDAAVMRPDLKSKKAVVVGMGINPFYSDIDPYWTAALAIDESLRNLVCCGADLKKTYILDNFCWGSPQEPETLGGLVRASRACYDFATYFKVPFISGKDSLYNEYSVEGRRISIPGTLLISAISVIDDWESVCGNAFNKKGNLIYLVGETQAQLGASQYFRNLKISGGVVPKVNRKNAMDIFTALSKAIKNGLACSCHDLSEGGLAVGLSEMCMGSGFGANVFLTGVPAQAKLLDYEILFSESPTRFIVEVEKGNKNNFEKTLQGLPFGLIGCVSAKPDLAIYGKDGKPAVNISLAEINKAWTGVFGEFK